MPNLILNKKVLQKALLTCCFLGALIFANNVQAETTINFVGIQAGASTCSGGGSGSAGGPCQSVITNNSTVGLTPSVPNDTSHHSIVGTRFIDVTSQSTANTTYFTRDIKFGATNGVVPANGSLWNAPGGDASDYEAQYTCRINGNLLPGIVEPLNSDGRWTASLPDGASCDLEVVNTGVTIPDPDDPTACDGTPGNPCYIGMCQSGQCKVVTQYANGDSVQPGDQNQCAVSETDCLTHFTISVSPVSSTVNVGGSSVYVVTFNFNGNKPYRSANINVSAPGLSNNNFSWSGTGYDNPTLNTPSSNPSFGRLDMYNNSTGAIDQTRTLFLTVNNAPRGSYTLNIRASTGDVVGVNADWSYNLANCFGNCNPTANANLTVNLPNCTNNITTSPSNGVCSSISSTGYTLGWTRAAGAYPTQYVRVSTSYDGVASGLCAVVGSPSYDPVNCRNDVSAAASTFPVTGLQANTTYYNRVVAACTNPDGSIGYKDTPVWSCTTNNPGSSCVSNPTVTGYLPNPAILSAASGNITVNWGTIAGANNYRVELENTDTGAIVTQNNIAGGSTVFPAVTPAPGGTTYKVRVYSNVTSPVVACGGVSEYMITVYPPATSCPGAPGTVVLNKYSAALGDFTVKASSPGGYNCADFNSSNTVVADVLDPASGSPSSSFLDLNSAGSTNISASGCVYQGGPTCPVNSAPLTVTNTPPGGGTYDFSLNPLTFNFTATLDPVSNTLVNITPAFGNLNLTANAGNPGQLQITMPWRLGEGVAPQFSDDVEMDAFYALGPGATWNFGNNIIIQDNPIVRFPGSYTDTIVYAGYTDAGVAATKSTSNKSITINLQVENATSENVSYTVSPANLTFPASGSTTRGGSTPPSQNITVTNTGDTTLSIAVAESIAWADYSIVGGGPNPFTLAPSATKTITVSMNTTDPVPNTQISYSGAINFTESLAGNKSVGVTYNFAGGGGGSCTLVNGGWTAWSECSSGTRTRTCTNPTPSCGGAICSGASSEACGNNPQKIKIIPSWCGSVSSAPAGISCGATCEANFIQDTDVTLTATPSARCVFIEWQGNCTGSNPVCTLRVNGEKIVTPVFGLKPFFYQEF